MTNPRKNNLEIKQQLYQMCQDLVEERFQTVQNSIREIQESLTSETKSSAGDKHETGRAMLQLEREKAGHQLAEIEKVKENLSKIDLTKSTETVSLGSLVFSSQANYFIAISAGEIQVNGLKFFAISPNTPIGYLLMGKTLNEKIIFKEQTIKILELL